MKQIPVGKKHFALVDDADYEALRKWSWQMGRSGYAVHEIWLGRDCKPTKIRIWMHRELCDVTAEHPFVDHRNQNKLDNQRHNLRASNKSENGTNRGRARHNSTGYKGVVKHGGKGSKGYIAQIRFQNKNRYLGYFSNPRDAAAAYNAAAVELFGDFAYLNTL